MTRQLPLAPDPMPLREALRGLRHFLRRGGETLRETVSTDAIPGPAAGFAGSVLREVESFARGVDQMASGLAKTVLGRADPSPSSFQSFASDSDADARFAAAVYSALRAVLEKLGAAGAFVSEAAIRKAFARISDRIGQASDAEVGADMTLALIEARAIRGATAEEASHVPGGALAPVAVFAAMLWMQSDRSEDENEAALAAAADLAVALAGDVGRAASARDAGLLAALFAEFAAHV